METVGVRQLKAHLSAYIREASKGDDILITDRGVVVARLVAADEASALQRLIDLGVAMPPAHAARPEPSPRELGVSISDLASDQRR